MSISLNLYRLQQLIAIHKMFTIFSTFCDIMNVNYKKHPRKEPLMKLNLKGKWKILIIFGVLFLTICLLLLMIFYQGKKSYTVKFDLDGGILISGSLEQRVTQGQDAIPPKAAKDGAYLRGWSASHQRITRDIVIKAIWEYETTVGIVYADSKNQNFTEIIGSYPQISGEVYLGAYYDNKKILGIGDEAFMNRTRITKVYLLNGIMSIGERAFAGCSSLKEITIPETVNTIKKEAFKGCKSLEVLILNEGITKIEAGAFENCESLKAIILPESLICIEPGAFDGCHDLSIMVKVTEENKPLLWMTGWEGSATIEWYVDPTIPMLPQPDEEESTDEGDSVETDENGKPIDTTENGGTVEEESSHKPNGGK